MLVLLALLGLSLSAFAELFSQQYDLVFVLHDAGESLGLQPVVDIFLQDKLNVSILCLGEPSTTIYAEYPQSTTLDKMGITDVEIIDGTQEGREQLLSEEDMQHLQVQLPSSVVICGMAYAMQSQICSNLVNSSGIKSYSISFYDSFSLWSNTSVAATYFTNPTPETVQSVMVSAGDQMESLTSPPDEVSAACSIALTGSPTLETWNEVDANETKKTAMRKALYGFENLDIVGIVFAGGYGEDEYVNSLEIFCSTALELCEDNDCIVYENSQVFEDGGNATYAFIFTPHPGYSSTFELELFVEWGCSNIIGILPEAFEISTADVVVASNISMSQCSTVGGQSISVGVAHAYLTEHGNCEDVFTANDLIPIASTADEAIYLLLESESFRGPEGDYYVDPSVLVSAGVPVNGTENIVAFINSYV